MTAQSRPPQHEIFSRELTQARDAFIERLRGHPEDADALDGLGRAGSGARVFALARLAELRVRQGRLGEARTLLEGYEDHPQTVAACVDLALARGELELACSLASRRLGTVDGDDTGLASALLLCAEAPPCVRDVEGASAAAEQLFELGEQLRRADLTAFAHLIAGRVEASRGVDEGARSHLERALDAFRELQMPLEEGRARLELARIESRDLALLHAPAAIAGFEQLGAITTAGRPR